MAVSFMAIRNIVDIKQFIPIATYWMYAHFAIVASHERKHW